MVHMFYNLASALNDHSGCKKNVCFICFYNITSALNDHSRCKKNVCFICYRVATLAGRAGKAGKGWFLRNQLEKLEKYIYFTTQAGKAGFF